MQDIERDIGLERRSSTVGDIAADIDSGDAIAAPLSAAAQAVPERSETSRSADQPPIRTATCLVVIDSTLAQPGDAAADSQGHQ